MTYNNNVIIYEIMAEIEEEQELPSYDQIIAEIEEKQERMRQGLQRADAFMAKAQKANRKSDLLGIPEIRGELLLMVGLSEEAAKYFTPAEQEVLLEEMISDLPDEDFLYALHIQYLLRGAPHQNSW